MDPRSSRRRLLLAVLSSIVLGASALAAPEPDSVAGPARAMVRTTIDRVLGELMREGVEDEVKIKSLEKIVFGSFDFGTISRLVLARNIRKFSKPQRGEFEDHFKVYLSRSYGMRLIRYASKNVELRDARVEPRGDVTVMTVIVGGAVDGIEMNYRVRNRNHTWKIIDVTIEGISLVSNYRTQFKDIVNRHGPEGLLKRLRDKAFALPDPE